MRRFSIKANSAGAIFRDDVYSGDRKSLKRPGSENIKGGNSHDWAKAKEWGATQYAAVIWFKKGNDEMKF